MGSPRWFYIDGGRSLGPETEADLVKLLRDGAVSGDTMVWTEGADGWAPLSAAVPLLAAQPPPIPGAAPSQFSLRDSAAPAPSAPRRERLTPLMSDQRNAGRPASSAWSDTSPHPWRRYVARLLDQTVSATFGFGAFGAVLAAVDGDAYQGLMTAVSKPENNFLSAWVITIVAIPVNAVFIGFTGTSLGKWIFGIRILDHLGVPMGFMKAFRREGIVWFKGLGMGIPLVSLVTTWRAYSKLTKTGYTSWDHDLRLTLRHRSLGMFQVFMSIFGVVLFVAIVAVLGMQ